MRSLLMLVLCLLSGLLNAQGMDTQLANTFHSMSNSTNPQFSTEGRPTATLGSFSYRTPVVRPQLISYDPPRFSGGCGGIDLYGGSFSFISKEELQGLLRQIAANAKSYAFMLALGAVCNKCLQGMQDLQDKVQKINQMMKSSCDIGQALVNSAADPMIAQMNTSYQQRAQSARQGGTVSDLWAAMNQGWGRESPEAALARENPDEFARIQPGNLLWRLLNEHGLASWFPDHDESLKTDLQSFLGTVVVCAPADTSACTEGEVEPEDRPKETRLRKLDGVLDIEELVLGSEGVGGQSSEIRCDEHQDCLRPSVQVRAEPRIGLKRRILDVLIGSRDGSQVGYIKRARFASAEPTEAERALLSNAPSQMAMLDRAIDISEHNAMQMADALAESMAVEMVYRYLGQVTASVRRAAAGVGATEAAQLARLVDVCERRNQRGLRRLQARLTAQVQVLQGLKLSTELAPTPDLRVGAPMPAGR